MIHWNVWTTDILLNVFLAIAVDSLECGGEPEVEKEEEAAEEEGAEGGEEVCLNFQTTKQVLMNAFHYVKAGEGQKIEGDEKKIHWEEEVEKGGEVAIEAEVAKDDQVAVKMEETEMFEVGEEKKEPKSGAEEAPAVDGEATTDGPDPLPEGSSFFIFSNTNR